MEKYFLKKVSYKYYDDEYDRWRTIHESYIITEQGNHETYLIDSSEVFRLYNEDIEQWNGTGDVSKYFSIDIEHLILIKNEKDLEDIKRIFKINTTEEYLKTIYLRIQHYGGGEEGGWYYHTLTATNLKEDEVEIGTDRYGEGYVIYEELYFGQHENTKRQTYC